MLLMPEKSVSCRIVAVQTINKELEVEIVQSQKKSLS